MLCQKCKKNEANVFLSESINGKEKTYALCSDCARELKEKGEFNSPISSSFFDTDIDVGNLFSSLLGGHSSVANAAKSKRCPICGSTFANFVKLGRAGCSGCYAEFSSEIADTVSRIHGNTVHKGRAPKAFKKKFDRAKLLSDLKNQLASAIATEEFERAAELRDKIREIEAQ